MSKTEKNIAVVRAKYPEAYACRIVPTKAAIDQGFPNRSGFGIRVNVPPFCISPCISEEAAWATAKHLIGEPPQGMSPMYEFANAEVSPHS